MSLNFFSTLAMLAMSCGLSKISPDFCNIPNLYELFFELQLSTCFCLGTFRNLKPFVTIEKKPP